MQIATGGLDIAKNVFQVHGIAQRGQVVLRKRRSRGQVLAFFANLPRCLIGLEACGGRPTGRASCRRSDMRRG